MAEISERPAHDTATVGVLIVDDQPQFRDVARTVVSLLPGWRVVDEVGSGEAAFAAVDRYRPRLVLMDINLPGMSGIDVTREITGSTPDTMVVLLSTYAIDDLPADALSCGAAGYIRKENLTSARLRTLVLP